MDSKKTNVDINIDLSFRKYHVIKRRNVNILDLKLQYTYGMLVTTFMVLDQVKQIFLEFYYDFLGPNSAFFYWILGFFVENLGSRKVT